MQAVLEAQMKETGRSGCPINLTLEILGDRWSLIVLRDIMFGNRRHFRELLAKSDEGIASNILADRLKRLLGNGLLSRRDDESHKQKGIYSLTEMGISLVPVFAAMADWGRRFLPVTPEMSIRAEILAEGGPTLWAKFMTELRFLHLDAPRPAESVLDELTEAYRCVVERRQAADAEREAV
jgi:DNA-binding HxlR family transcriptional regulator